MSRTEPDAAVHGFAGFPDGRLRATRIPSIFFSELLPLLDDLDELKVVLFCFWFVGQRPAAPFVRLSELAADDGLVAAFGGDAGLSRLRDGLARATQRGALIHAVLEDSEGRRDDCYFLNSEAGRAAVAKARRGDWNLSEAAPDHTVRVDVERPNIYVLYEQNIGLLQPLVADELRDAEQRYPADWIEDAFREAARRNKRHWRYVQRILERWATEGKHDDAGHKPDTATGRRRYISGDYTEFIEY